MVVDADHYPALAPAHKVGHTLVRFEGEVDAIAGGLPVRRVHAEERVRSIVALSAGEPGQVLDVGAGEALPSGGQILLDAQQVDGRSSGGGTERLPRDLVAEGMLLQVEKPIFTMQRIVSFTLCLLAVGVTHAEKKLQVIDELPTFQWRRQGLI